MTLEPPAPMSKSRTLKNLPSYESHLPPDPVQARVVPLENTPAQEADLRASKVGNTLGSDEVAGKQMPLSPGNNVAPSSIKRIKLKPKKEVPANLKELPSYGSQKNLFEGFS